MRLSRLLTAFLILSLGLSVGAQTPLDAFHQAIDAFEYEKAAQLAQKLPPGAKELALAEVDVLSGRPDRSFSRTDALDPKALAAELQAKFYLVRAYQEAATYYSLRDEGDRAVSRMLRDGLRATGSPHDRAALLMMRIARASADQDALALEASQELAELEGVDAKLPLQAQAILAERDDRYREASNLWKSLAETAGLKGQKSAQVAFSLNALRCQTLAQPERKAETFASARQLFLQSLSSDEVSKVILLKAWNALARYSSDAEVAERLRLGQQALAKLPDSDSKLAMFDGVLSLTRGEAGIPLAQQGIELAHKLDEPLLEAYFIDRSAERFPLYATRTSMRRKAAALLDDKNTRGAVGTFFSYAPWLIRKESASLSTYGRPITVEEMEKDLAAATDLRQRIRIFDKYVSAAFYESDARLAELAFFQGVDEALAMPEADRSSALETMLGSTRYPGSWTRLASPQDLRGDWRLALIRGLGAKLSQKPEIVEKIWEVQLPALRRSGSSPSSHYASLAAWLDLLGRETEARELLEMAVAASSSQSSYLERFGSLLLRLGNVEALPVLRKVEPMKDEQSWLINTRLGWVALDLGQRDEAEQYARSALSQPPSGEEDRFIDAGPFQVLAEALASKGETDAALATLDDGMRLHGNRYSPPQSLLLSRAAILSKAGRHREAANTLRGVRIQPPPRMSAYELALRRDVARATKNAAALAELDELERLFLQREASLPQDPVFASAFRQAAAAEKVNLATVEGDPASSFGSLLESLERLRRREPDNASLKRLSAAELKELMDRAGAEEIFVQPVLLSHSVATVYVTKEGAGLIETFCDRQRLEQAMLGLTASLSSPEAPIEASEADRAYLAGRLIFPWRTKFPNKTRLRWMGDGPLQKLPISALPDTDLPLIGAMSVTYLDGPGYHALKVGPGDATLLVGGASDLSGSAAELKAVRTLLPKGESWELGGDLTKLRTLVSQHRVLHISTHGSAPSSLELGGRLTGDDRELSSFDLAELSFADGSLAVLGACDSYVDAGTGHDNTSLVSALRTAGADVVVGSLWPLDDAVTAELFGVFYRDLLSGSAPERALAKAQMAVRQSQAHPYYWAGLQVVSGP